MFAHSLALLALVAAVSCFQFETNLQEGEVPIKWEPKNTLKMSLKKGECKKVIDLTKMCRDRKVSPPETGIQAIGVTVTDDHPYPSVRLTDRRFDTVTVTRKGCHSAAPVIINLQCRHNWFLKGARGGEPLDWAEDGSGMLGDIISSSEWCDDNTCGK